MEELILKFKERRLSDRERISFLEELYWINWNELESKDVVLVEEIFALLRSKKLSQKEISLILKLYNNPGGEYVDKFSHIISNIYLRDRIKFIQALNLERDQISNLVYLFRNNKVFEDAREELKEILASQLLSSEEVETANEFFKSYDIVCSS